MWSQKKWTPFHRVLKADMEQPGILEEKSNTLEPSMFVDFMWYPCIPKNLRMYNKVMNCLTLLCNKPNTHEMMLQKKPEKYWSSTNIGPDE